MLCAGAVLINATDLNYVILLSYNSANGDVKAFSRGILCVN